jgi:tetratricopeptide (TPR) repeat protein
LKKFLFVVFLCCYQILQAQHVTIVDSLVALIGKGKDTSKVNTYNLLAWEYRNSDLNKTDSFANLAIDLAMKKSFYKGLGKAYINKGLVYKNACDYSAALQTYRWALVNFVKANDKSGFSSVYNNVASVYYLQSSYTKAQYYYFQSLNISEELKDQMGIAKTLNNIGVVYMEQQQFEKAIQYFKRAYAILLKFDVNEAADCLNNIGSVYQYKGDTAQALKNYKESLAINKKIGDKKDVSSVLNNIGYMYYEIGDYKQALDHYHQSLKIDEELGDIRSMSASYGNISNCYIKLKMLHAASKYAEQILSVAKAHNIRTDITDAYKMLNEIEEENGNYKQALIYHKLYKAYNDSVFNDQNNNVQAQLEARYLKEKAEKEKLINTKEGEMSIFKAKEKDKEVSQYILLIGMVLLLFVLIIYVVFFLLRKNKYS